MVGEHAVSSSEDGTLKVWDLARGAVTKTLEGHSHGILGLWADAATSGAAPRVVSGGFDADLRQWDVTKGRCVRTMAGHGGPVVSIEADDDKIVSSSFDGTLRVWNWDGHARATLPAHDGHSSGLALLGDVAFSGGDDGLVKRCGPTSAPSAAPASPAARLTRPKLTQKLRTRWDLRTETCTDAVEAHSGAVWSVRASEALLLSASTDCALKLWDLRAPVRIPYMRHAAARALDSLLTRAPPTTDAPGPPRAARAQRRGDRAAV